MTYTQLSDELRLLASASDWEALRVWFSYWSNAEEQADKCLLWGRFFLPEYFRDQSPEFHKDLVRQNLSNQNEFCAAPRGFSKTTLNQLCINFQIANKLEKFIVIIEKSFTEASEVLRSISKVWRDNQMVRQVYGSLVKVGDTGQVDEKNSDNQGDVFVNGVRVRAKGFEAPIRGIKADNYRPTKIYMDDVESDEHIGSEEQRRKYRENYSQGVVPAIDPTGSIKVRGTILHSDSLLMNLIEQFHGKIYKAFDKNDPEHTLLWPERWPYALLMKKKAEMELQGKGTASFYKEYLNEPVDDESRPFRIEWLQKEFTDEDIKMKALSRTATIDVAESLKQGADYTAVTIVDWDQDNNWFIQHAKRHKVNVTGLVDLIFSIWQFYKPTKIGVEKKAFIDQVRPLLTQRSEEVGIYPIVVELEHQGKAKEDRIKGALQGRFEAGKIWFKKGAIDDSTALKGELIDFPTGKKDDLVDSLAYHQQIGFRPMGRSITQQTTMEKEFWAHKKQTQGDHMLQRIRNL